MSVHQCPRCALRFSYRTELELHLREDHDREASAESTEHAGGPGVRQRLTQPPGGRVDQLVAASPPATSTRSRVSPAPAGMASYAWPDLGPAADVRDDNPDTHLHTDRRLPPVTLMPRWIVMAVIVLVVGVLGLGLLFGW